MTEKNKEHCSFCGKPYQEAGQLVAGPDGVYICDACVDVCSAVIEKSGRKNNGSSELKLDVPKPHEILEELNEHVVGQDHVKKVLSVAVHNHYKRVKYLAQLPPDHNAVEIEKSNILMVGPTGSGKTLLAKTLAKLLDVPFSIADATTLTEAGYVGEDVENILLRLVQAADGDMKRAEVGIIYVDEIDKIGRRTENVSITRDVSGEGVQQALLKILEGTVASFSPKGGRKHPEEQLQQMNTKNILFICGGAFVGMDEIIRRRTGKGNLGYHFDVVAHAQRNTNIEPEDLLQFGLIPEFIGRLPVVTELKALTDEELMRILTEPKNAIVKQYTELLGMEGVELSFQPEALEELAAIARHKGTGARGLRSIFEHFMLDIMYDVPMRDDIKEYNVTSAMIQKHFPYIITKA